MGSFPNTTLCLASKGPARPVDKSQIHYGVWLALETKVCKPEPLGQILGHLLGAWVHESKDFIDRKGFSSPAFFILQRVTSGTEGSLALFKVIELISGRTRSPDALSNSPSITNSQGSLVRV